MQRKSLKELLKTNVGEGLDHARVSPSSIKNIISCPASLVRSEGLVKDDSEDVCEAAKNGTALHEYSEHFGRYLLGEENEEEWTKKREQIKRENPELDYDEVRGYQEYMVELVKNNIPFVVEQRVDATSFFPECFGTADLIAYDKKNKTLIIADLKTGMIQIKAKENPQLMTYAHGAYLKIKDYYEIEKIELRIYQPQSREGFRCWRELTPEILKEWVVKVAPIINEAIKGEGKENAGPTQCKYCERKNECQSYKKMKEKTCQLAYLPKEEIPNLSSKELVQYYGALKEFTQIETQIRDEIKKRIKEGENIEGVIVTPIINSSFMTELSKKFLNEAQEKDADISKLLGSVSKKGLVQFSNEYGIDLAGYLNKTEGTPRLLIQ